MTYRKYTGVALGKNAEIGDFVVIGLPVKGRLGLETIIGDDAVIRSHTVIYAGNRIGNGFQTGHGAQILYSNQIGHNVSIGTLSVVAYEVVIEDGVRIHTQAFIPEHSVLRSGCWIGPNVVLTNARYPLSIEAKKRLEGVQVGSKARIGANVTILPGIIIGENALIGAGSVVTKDVEAYAVMVGNPARWINDVREIRYADTNDFAYPDD